MTEYTAFHCRCCRRQLGITDGVRLILGEGAYSDEAIPLRCTSCGLRQVWKPVRKIIDMAVTIVYTESVPV